MAVPAASTSAAFGRRLPTLDPNDPLTQSLGRRALGTVAGVANFLDIPGSMVRDVAMSASTGDWGKYNPLDQLLPWNWTTGEGRVTGRELNRELGLAGRRDTTGNWWGGLGTEIALDPLTYMSFGASALSKPGRIARSAGVLDDLLVKAAPQAGKRVGRMTTGLADLVPHASEAQLRSLSNAAIGEGFSGLTDALRHAGDKPLGSLMGVNWPFGQSRAIMGTGAAAQRFAGVLDKAGHAIRYSWPVRKAAQHLYAPVRDTATEIFQPAAQKLHRLREGALGETRQFIGRTIQKFHDAGITADDDVIYDAVRSAFEDPISRITPPNITGIPDDVSSITLSEFLSGRPAESEGFFDIVMEDLPLHGPPGLSEEAITLGDAMPLHLSGMTAKAIVSRSAQGVANAVGITADLGNGPTVISFARNPAAHGISGQRGAIDVMRRIASDGVSQPIDSLSVDSARLVHRMHVEDAVARGKNVPQDVLQDYPSLQAGRLSKIFMTSTARADFLAQHPNLAPVFDEVTSEFADEVRQAQNLGRNPNELIDIAIQHFFPRYGSKHFARDPRGIKSFGHFDPSAEISRKLGYKNIARGTEQIRQILHDPDLQRLLYGGRLFPSGAQIPQELQHLAVSDIGGGMRVVGGHTAQEVMRAGNKILRQNPQAQETLTDFLMQKYPDTFLGHTIRSGVKAGKRATARAHASLFSNQIRELSPESVAAGLFGNHPIVDLNARMLHARYARMADEMLYDTLANPEVFAWQGRSGERVAIEKVLENVGLDKNIGLQQLADRLGWHADNIANQNIAKELAEDAGRLMKSFTAPDSTNELVQAFDTVTNLFKGYVTGLWPAFHTRNLVSGQFQNWFRGLFSISSWNDSRELVRGGAPRGLANIPIIRQRLAAEGLGITDSNAADMLRRMAFENDVVHHGQGDVANVIGTLGEVEGGRLNDMLGQFPGGLGGSRPYRWGFGRGGLLNKAINADPDTTWKMWAQRGVGGRRESEFFLGAAGEQVGNWIESMNRLVPFLEQIRKGVDPAEAARIVKQTQVDYASRAYTQFEKQFLTRIFPFYKFQRGMIPLHLKMIAEQPGGKLGQLLRTISRGRAEEEGPLPEYVSDTAAVRIPQNFPVLGSQSDDPAFVTGGGLMFEDPISMLPVGGVGLRGMGLELLSRTNPLIKAPLEAVTGQSFFQRGPRGGRPLTDLDPVIGRTMRNMQQIPPFGDMSASDFVHGRAPEGYTPPVQYPGQRWAEPILSNSPISRFLTSARVLSDPRKSAGSKAANLLFGLRITNVSEATQEAILRERAADALSEFPESREFVKSYIPTELLTDMDESARLEAEQLLALTNMLAQRSQARKEARERERTRRR